MNRTISSIVLTACLMMAGAMFAEPVRIMGIGNSFTVDALEQHMQPLCTAEGREVIIGYPYRGGTELSQHDAWSTRDTLPYNYRKFEDGQFSSTGLGTYSLAMALEDEPWDYVFIQSDHDSAGIYRSYVPYMEHLIDFVHLHCSNPDVKIGFYMTWPYDAGSTYSGFNIYGKNQQAMYDSIINAAQQVMANHPELELLIPCGTAVQNCRTSYIGERMNRDGYHLNYNHGRYVAALCWYEVIFNKSALEVTWKPSSITDYCADMCRHAVHAAIETPYAVTSLAADYSEPEHEEIVPGTESHLRRVTVNGMNVPLVEGDSLLYAHVDYTINPASLYAYPIDANAELNITDVNGSDIERDVTRPNYYPLPAPAENDTVRYTIRVISEAMGADETIYQLFLIGAQANTLVYPIASREDLELFAATVNGGAYSINGLVTTDFSCDHEKQDCWMTPIGAEGHPWTGTFDGGGHTISGFNIYSVDNELLNLKYVGLFGLIQNATIKNLRIEGTEESYFNRPSSGTNNTGDCSYGILCGAMISSTIQDCSVSLPIFTNVNGNVGMIVGRNEAVSGAAASLVQRCHVAGTWRVRHTGIYAGIMGYGYNAVISDCYSTCTMALQQDKAGRIGGILGYVNASSNRSLTIQNCHFYGKLTPFEGATNTSYIGAVAGVFNGTAVTTTNCWYLAASAPAVFGQHKNYSTKQTATEGTTAQFADGTVTTALGEAWEQGTKYPELKAPDVEPVTPSAITEIEGAQSGWTKVIRDGRLLIINGAHAYDAQGARVR